MIKGEKDRVTQLDKRRLPVGGEYVRFYIQVLDTRVQSRQVTMLGQSMKNPTGISISISL